MENWYLWVIFAVLCIAAVAVMNLAAKALQAHNNETKSAIEVLKRLKSLKEKYTLLTEDKISSAEPSELVEGVTAVMQAKIEKAEDPTALFSTFSDAQKNIYTLNYFTEDVSNSLSYFYRNNGEPLVSIAHPFLSALGETETAQLCEKMFSMLDSYNDEVSVDNETIKHLDSEFDSVYNESALLEKAKRYISENINQF